MMISYAQNLEDVLLQRAFAGQVDGFYIDAGAHHPMVCSVTKHFYDLGWHGINVEPSATFAELERDRPRDVNLDVGLSDAERSLTFYEFPDVTSLSTFCPKEATDRQAEGHRLILRPARLRTLASICEEYVRGPIDFLKIDVEGYELEVLRGNDWSRWRPRVVLLEATEPNTPIPNHAKWEPTLLAADYVFAQFDGLNRYYVAAEERELADVLSVPVNLFDEAVSHEHYERRRQLDELRQEHSRLQTRLLVIDPLEQRIGTLEREIVELQRRLAPSEGLGDWSLAVARRVNGLSRRLPGVSSVAKNWLSRWRRVG